LLKEWRKSSFAFLRRRQPNWNPSSKLADRAVAAGQAKDWEKFEFVKGFAAYRRGSFRQRNGVA